MPCPSGIGTDVMPRGVAWRLAIVLVLAMLGAGGFPLSVAGRGAEGRAEVGASAPDFALTDLNGTPIRLSDLRGKRSVLLSFWASWCPSCQEEMPTLAKLHEKFGPRGLEIVAVSIDADQADVAQFVLRHGVTSRALWDRNGQAARKYRVTAVPTHYFIDKRGVIRWREAAGRDWSRPESWKLIESFLGDVAPAPDGSWRR
jgi:cytochrome c biogenesis protein CcmG/thiol:disulfide interchange protein DsbE